MICIFDCGYDEGGFNRADSISGILNDAGFGTSTFNASKNEFPASMEDYAGFIITGSPRYPYDKDEWIGRLKDAVRIDKPVLGICMGHQLLSIIRGGKAERMPGGRNFGYKEVALTDAGKRSPLFKGVSSPLVTFFSHRYIVTRLQPGAVLLASNDAGIQAFQHGNYYGVQFHPDFSWAIAKHFAEKYKIDPLYPGAGKARQSWKTNKRILVNFAGIAEKPLI